MIKKRIRLRQLFPILMIGFLFAHNAFAAPIPGLSSLGVEVGNLAPEFTFQDASGKWVSLSDFRGKKVFIFSWSSWCRCKYQLPDLEKFYRQYKSDKFEIIAVASDTQGFKYAKYYLDKADATFVSLVDPNNELGKKYNFWATENGFLIDESGVIRMSVIGFQINNPEQRELLIKLMGADFKIEQQKLEPISIDERIKQAEEGIARNPKIFPKRLELAELYRQSGDLKKSEITLRDAIRRKRFSAESHYRLGVVLYQEGKIKPALREWKKARALDPMNYLYMRNIQVYYKPEKFYGDVLPVKKF